MAINLEDNFSDVVSKAQRGLKLADSELSERTGVPVAELHQLRSGRFDADALRKVAPVLGLDSAALIDLPNYKPAEISLPGLATFTTAFGEMLVNAYIAFDPEKREAAAFDTGVDAAPMLEYLRQENLALRFIFLTHTHADHVMDLDRLRSQTGAAAYVSSRESAPGAQPFAENSEFRCGDLRIGTRLTWGHSRGGTTYVISGLERPVAIVGDSLFAGSMGGGMASYDDALRTNREQIFTLAGETVLCPGHGPLTTVYEERAHNPFFA